MKKVLSVIIISVLSLSLTQAQSVDEIVSKYITAIGGAAKQKALKSRKMTMVLHQSGVQIPGSIIADAENRQKVGFTIPAYRRVDIGFSKVLLDAKSENRPMWLRNTESLWMSLEIFNLLQVNNTSSYILVKDFANTVYGVPNYLTGRRLNLRFILKI